MVTSLTVGESQRVTLSTNIAGTSPIKVSFSSEDKDGNEIWACDFSGMDNTFTRLGNGDVWDLYGCGVGTLTVTLDSSDHGRLATYTVDMVE